MKKENTSAPRHGYNSIRTRDGQIATMMPKTNTNTKRHVKSMLTVVKSILVCGIKQLLLGLMEQ